MTAPTDPCAHCGHPRDGHGTRYAAIPGRHKWAEAGPSFRLISHSELGCDRYGRWYAWSYTTEP